MFVCKFLTIFLIVSFLTVIKATYAHTEYVEDEVCPKSDIPQEQLCHLTKGPEDEMNRIIPPIEPGAVVSAPCATGFMPGPKGGCIPGEDIEI